MQRESPSFPRLNQRQMAAFLAIKVSRLEWATHEGLVERGDDGLYRPEIVTAQWFEYERGLCAKGKKRSELERERTRLTRAKAEAAELRLAALRKKLVDLDEHAGALRAVCLRIRAKLGVSTQRLAHECYYAPSLAESLAKARREIDVVLSELAATGGDDLILEPSLAVVPNDETGPQTQK